MAVRNPGGGSGSPGPPGPTGPAGMQGALGFDGLDGQDGLDSLIPGPQGLQGQQGIPGTNGIIGRDGNPGLDGIDGIDGLDSLIPGPSGSQGSQGIQGVPGPPGIDAEETEFPYIIPGPTGPQGPSGGGGGGTFLQATVDFGSPSSTLSTPSSVKATITDAGVAAISKIVASVRPVTTRDLDEAELGPVIVSIGNIIAGVSFDVLVSAVDETAEGQYLVDCTRN